MLSFGFWKWQIRFRIHSIEYPAIPVEQPKERDSKFPMEEKPKENINVKAFAPMIVTVCHSLSTSTISFTLYY